MHTVWVRLNAVVFFGLTVLLGLSCLAALSKSTHVYYYKPSELLSTDISALYDCFLHWHAHF